MARGIDLAGILGAVSVDDFLLTHFGASLLHARGEAGKFDCVAGAESELAEHLERILEAPVEIRLDTHPVETGLSREERDILILQAGGHSVWKGFGNFRKQPEDDGASAWKAELDDGHALYIPAGWWRARQSVAAGAREFRIVIDSPTGKDLLHWLAELLKNHELLQAPVPRFADPAARAEYLTTFRRAVGRAIQEPGLLERYRRHLNRRARREHPEGVPWTPETPEDHLLAFAMPRTPEIRRDGEDTICILGAGQRFVLPEAAAPLLLYLRDRAPVSISSFFACFEGEFHRDELHEFLADLSRSGAVVTRPDRKHV